MITAAEITYNYNLLDRLKRLRVHRNQAGVSPMVMEVVYRKDQYDVYDRYQHVCPISRETLIALLDKEIFMVEAELHERNVQVPE